jgi:hypothetical protein
MREIFLDIPTARSTGATEDLFYLHLCHSIDKLQYSNGENIYLVLQRVARAEAVFEWVGLARNPGRPDFDGKAIQRLTII